MVLLFYLRIGDEEFFSLTINFCSLTVSFLYYIDSVLNLHLFSYLLQLKVDLLQNWPLNLFPVPFLF